MIVDKFIGIRHLFNGDNYDGADCIGLCRLFYKEHGWKQDFKDGKEVTKDWQRKDRSRLFRYLSRNFKEIKAPELLEYGDVVVFNVNGDYHLGIYLSYGEILAMQVPVIEGETISTIYHKEIWEKAFKAGFKRG